MKKDVYGAQPFIVGLDIGGANLKAATTNAQAYCVPWPLWRYPEGLASQIRELACELPGSTKVAVTMTGELCDCFPDKASGVRYILRAVCEAMPSTEVAVWTVEDRFCSVDEAMGKPLLAAAANWRALAFLAAHLVRQHLQDSPPEAASSALGLPGVRVDALPTSPQGAGWCLLLDVGSTTTDLIPLGATGPTTPSRTDLERLRRGELLYLGARRTPLCALLPGVLVDGVHVYPAAEYFADIYDAFLLLGLVPERSEYHMTADGRPATVHAARQRLARMLCADAEELSEADLFTIAQTALTEWQNRFALIWRHLLARYGGEPDSVVLAGEGEWLAKRCLSQLGYAKAILSFDDMLGPEVSQAACAYAVAWLLARSA